MTDVNSRDTETADSTSASAPVPALEFNNVSCRFEIDEKGNGYTATQGVSFTIADGEFVSVVGPTGCGKSTILNMAAGLLTPSEGSIRIFGKPVAGIDPRVGYMFQADSLMPWATALDNVTAGLRFRGTPVEEANRRGMEWLARVGLDRFPDRYPHELSGGMRKRVAMAQTLINDPELILMDESFSALDVQTRQLMENELLEIWSAKKRAVLFITHDLEEAISMSDRVLVLSAGPASHPIADFRITLERPRNVADIRSTPAFHRIYSDIWAVLREEVMKSYEKSRSAI